MLMNSKTFTLLFSSYFSVFSVTTRSDKRHVIILFLYIARRYDLPSYLQVAKLNQLDCHTNSFKRIEVIVIYVSYNFVLYLRFDVRILNRLHVKMIPLF